MFVNILNLIDDVFDIPIYYLELGDFDQVGKYTKTGYCLVDQLRDAGF